VIFQNQSVFVIVCAAVLLGFVVFRFRRDQAHLAELKRAATRAFDECVVHSSDPRFAFAGKSANIQRREESGGQRGVLQKTAEFYVTIYASNPHGECFVFKWSSKAAKPFVKHLPNHDRQWRSHKAKQALR